MFLATPSDQGSSLLEALEKKKPPTDEQSRGTDELPPLPEQKNIDWTGSADPENPFNWSTAKKWRVTLVACFMTFVVQINGTMMTSAAEQINESFHVSDEKFPHSYWPILSWNLGGAAGPLLGLPLMENFGVRWTYLAINTTLVIFIIPQAIATNFTTIIITRIFAGSCSAVLANITSGFVSDTWRSGRSKSFGISLYIYTLLAGLSMGPVFGSLVVRHTTWRWIFISQIIFYSSLIPILYFLLPEVRPEVILKSRARRIRRETGEAVFTKDEKSGFDLQSTLQETLIRPSHMLCTEGVVLSLSLWSSFVIGIAFMFTQSIVQVYSSIYAWTYFSTGMVQSAIVIGETLGLAASLIQDRTYFNTAARNVEEPGQPIPEARLYLSIPASFIGLCGGLLLFAWTSFAHIPWIVPSVALSFVGFGMFCCTAALTTYLLDAYAKYAASACAAAAFTENSMAALLPLATQSMYRSLGFNWASSLLAFVALALSFIPIVIIRYGRRLRERSPFMSVAGHDDN